jgi:3-methyladenine DNA glycosylase AlkD
MARVAKGTKGSPLEPLGSAADVAAGIRRALRDGGSVEHASGVQWFFKDEIKSHGWYTADLRRAVICFRRDVRKEQGLDFLAEIADHLFSGSVLEEKVAAVFLLEKLDAEFGDREFKLFESWLDRISSWADHDGLVHCLIAPMVAAKPARAKIVFRWAKSPRRWHRRAACVALIKGARARMFFPEITRLSDWLLNDEDDMVQKGLGWLLRETAKFDAKRTVPYLMKIRERAPRLVLRTACETLPASTKRKILDRTLPRLRNSSARHRCGAASIPQTSGTADRASPRRKSKSDKRSARSIPIRAAE